MRTAKTKIGGKKSSGQQLPQSRPQLQARPAAMAEGVLEEGAQLAESLMIFRHEKERIVPEVKAPPR